jgi:hypothetical protein
MNSLCAIGESEGSRIDSQLENGHGRNTYIHLHAREWIGQLCGGMNSLCAIGVSEGIRIDSQPENGHG